MASVTDSAPQSVLARFWYDRDSRAVLIQIVTVALLFALVVWIASNTVKNLELLGKGYDFGFLGQPASYDINQHLIDYTSRDSHLRAGVVGVLNTLLVAGAGIVLATVLGFIFGVLRLSRNWVASRVVYVVIEFARNVPVLLHILLIYGVIVNILPHPRNALDIGGTFFLTNRGFYVPDPIFHGGFWAVAITFLIGAGFSIWYHRRAKHIQEETGRILPVFRVTLAAILGAPIVIFLLITLFAGAPLSWQYPALKGFNFQGGIVMRPEFLALWLALSLYTSCFIAEIVRGGILAINYGQTEAAYALGVPPGRTLRLIIIPQALRVIVPPLTSQYLNLTKNSSLAIAIGYMDILATIGGISLNQTGREMECMTIVLLIYLGFSLIISGFMNWYNKRIKLVER